MKTHRSGRSLAALPRAALLAIGICTCSGDEPTGNSPSLSEQLQLALDGALADYDGKGVSAAVALDGERRSS